MTQWEFHEVTIYAGHEMSGRRELEERGRAGWQIGGVARLPENGSITFYMQRPRAVPVQSDERGPK